ncbi:MAG: hypothetical protein LIP18_03675, partial [Planctomycetes bacterium]|nr:hypothetical protein [Planctomycetota bacterium]
MSRELHEKPLILLGTLTSPSFSYPIDKPRYTIREGSGSTCEKKFIPALSKMAGTGIIFVSPGDDVNGNEPPRSDCIMDNGRVNLMEPSSGMRLFLQYHRRMVVVMTVVSAAVWLVLRLAFRDSGLSTGYLIGAAAQLLKFGIHHDAVVRKIAVEKKNAAATQLKTGAVTLLLFAAAALFVITNGLSVWAMAAGIFLPRLVLIADTYIRPNPFGTGEDGSDIPQPGNGNRDGEPVRTSDDDESVEAPLAENDTLAGTVQDEDGSTGVTDRDRPPLE